jgi:hypothetical protein
MVRDKLPAIKMVGSWINRTNIVQIEQKVHRGRIFIKGNDERVQAHIVIKD